MYAHIICFAILLVSSLPAAAQQIRSSLRDKVICLDPGHGGTAATDHYRVGPSGEREEWINLRVAKTLKNLLEREGARVLMTREEDQQIALADRAALAVNGGADLFLSIHHNATADREVNYPIIYFHGSAEENKGSVALAVMLAEAFRERLFSGQGPASVVSDFAIFPNSGAAVLRGTYGIPAVIAEASFFSHAPEEGRLKKKSYNKKEARAYLDVVRRFFDHPDSGTITEKIQPGEIPPFPVFQEAERMAPEALRWRENFENGKRLVAEGNYPRALELLTLSVKSFPDSPFAGEAHALRSYALGQMGHLEEAHQEGLRVQFFYPQAVRKDH